MAGRPTSQHAAQHTNQHVGFKLVRDAVQAQLRAKEGEVAAARQEASSLQAAVSAARREAEGASKSREELARRVADAQAAVCDTQRSYESQLASARGDAAAAERRVAAAEAAHVEAVAEERRQAAAQVAAVQEHHRAEVEALRAEMADMHARLEVRCPSLRADASPARACGRSRRWRVQAEQAAHEGTRGEHELTREQLTESSTARDAVEAAREAAEVTCSEVREQLDAAQRNAAAATESAGAAAAAARQDHQARQAASDAEADALRAACAEAEARNAALQERIAALERDLATQHERQASALVRAGATRRQERAACVIQRQWRLWQRRQAADERSREVLGWRNELAATSEGQRRAAAQAGRSLVLSAVQDMEAATQTILMEMLLSGAVKRRVKAAQKAVGIGGAATPPPRPARGGAPGTPLSSGVTNGFHSTAMSSTALDSGPTTPVRASPSKGLLSAPSSVKAMFTPRAKR